MNHLHRLHGAINGLLAFAIVLTLVSLVLAGSADAAVRKPSPRPAPTPAPAPAPIPRQAPVTTADPLVTQLPTDTAFRPVARLGNQVLQAGKQYRIYGSWSGTSEMGSLMGARIEIYPAGAGSQRIRSGLSTRNHEGEEHGLAPGTVRAISTQGLFTIPGEAGEASEWVVELLGQAGRCDVTGGVCVIQPQYHIALSTVSLTLDPTPRQGGLEWRQPTDLRVGLAPRPGAVDALPQTHDLPDGTGRALVYTGTEISCESTGGNTPFRVRVTQQVRQFNAHTGFWSAWQKSAPVEMNISGTLHHYKFNQVQYFDLDPALGSTRVSVKVLVEYVPSTTSGQVRHGGVVHSATYSSGFVIPWS